MEVIKELKGHDELDIKNNDKITKILGPSEVIYYSGFVTKYNKYDWAQERIFVVTNLAIYNIK